MPLYDLMLLVKPHIKKEVLADLVGKVGKHVYRRNGVLTEIKAFQEVQLGYGIKKLDGRYYKGQLMQMTMMTPPSFNSELHYLNKEDRLLRWLLVKHRDVKDGVEIFSDDDLRSVSKRFESSLVDDEETEGEESDYDDGDDYESQVDKGERKEA